jgi:hypothetical protein
VASPEKPGLLYILGSARSGTTLCAMLASRVRGVFAAGELAGLQPDGDPAPCGCGAKLTQCALWSGVMDAWSRASGKSLAADYRWADARLGRQRQIPRAIMHAQLWGRPHPRWERVHVSLVRAVAEVAGADWIVDSSKSPVRALQLARSQRLRFKAVHVVRDPRGVGCSLMKDVAADPAAGVARPTDGVSAGRAARDWKRAHALATWAAGRLGAGATLRMRYETLLRRPNDAMRAIARHLGRDGAVEDDETSAWRRAHVASGNRMRMHPSTPVFQEDEWKGRLGRDDRIVIERSCKRAMQRLGYRPVGEG